MDQLRITLDAGANDDLLYSFDTQADELVPDNGVLYVEVAHWPSRGPIGRIVIRGIDRHGTTQADPHIAIEGPLAQVKNLLLALTEYVTEAEASGEAGLRSAPYRDHPTEGNVNFVTGNDV